MRIIYDLNSKLVVVTPTASLLDTFSNLPNETAKFVAVADKVLPVGTKYEIVSDAEVDKGLVSERDLWIYQSGPNERTAGAT